MGPPEFLAAGLRRPRYRAGSRRRQLLHVPLRSVELTLDLRHAAAGRRPRPDVAAGHLSALRRARARRPGARRGGRNVDMSGAWCVNWPHERVFWGPPRARRHHRPRLPPRASGRARRFGRPSPHRLGDRLSRGRSAKVRAIVGDIDHCRDEFVRSGTLTDRGLKAPPRKVDYNSDAILALAFDLDVRARGRAEETILVGYDDEFAIEYFHKKLRAWWRRDGTLDGPACWRCDARKSRGAEARRGLRRDARTPRARSADPPRPIFARSPGATPSPRTSSAPAPTASRCCSRRRTSATAASPRST